MTKPELKSILDRIDFWRGQSQKWQEAMREFCKVIAPNSYTPIIEDSYEHSFIEGVCMFLPELKEHLSYYAYELPTMNEAEGVYLGKNYDLKNQEEYIDFVLLSLWPNH